jgi:WD40 repeat protein/uncharacterized caspase-like protein
MARLRRGSAITLAVVLLFGVGGSPSAAAQSLYEGPVLVVDTGMHAAAITATDVDAAGRFIVTGSIDKTVRIWSVSDGKLLETIRVPAGAGNVGKIYAVAMSPDGNVVAAGGWTGIGEPQDSPIYLFDRSTGKMTTRILGDLLHVTYHLVFSSDGRYLAATLGGTGGLRVFDRENKWSEAFRDTNYGRDSYGAAFAADGRLATSSDDGKIRLYDRSFKLIVPPRLVPGGHPLRGLAFSPNGKVLAIGYDDRAAVDLVDGHTLARLQGPNTDDLGHGTLEQVAWSMDGQILFAGGRYRDTAGTPTFAWDHAGYGTRRAMSVCGASSNTVLGLVPLPAGQLLVAMASPCLTLLDANSAANWVHQPPGADLRGQQRSFAVSADGTIIDFDFELNGKSPLRFDLRTLTLSGNRPADQATRPPKQEGPLIDPKLIMVEHWEILRSLAVHPDGHRFVLGTSYALRAFDVGAKALWSRDAPSEVWAVNITGDGRLVVAAFGDGTIRWYRMDQGRELMALQVLSDKRNWVAWTPEGFYAATAGAYGVLRWQVNRGGDRAAETVPVSAIPSLKRPDALPLVLQELETARAVGIADVAAARRQVQLATGAAAAPGARLHVLAIGINDYGDKAKQFGLKFADKDAKDVAAALLKTQSSEYNKLGGLYAKVLVQYLHDSTADRVGIFNAFATIQVNMAKDAAGEDLAVIMFSGHGAVVDGHFYLLPYGVDAGTPAELKASAISADDFQAEVKTLAEHGRVLLLLDACHSGAVTADGSKLTPNADLLRSVLAQNNVTVLTSSKGKEPSREDDKWQNGAFTKVLMQALSGDADENHRGVISMSELTDYVSRQLPLLTNGQQHPQVEQRFQSDLFVAGL